MPTLLALFTGISFAGVALRWRGLFVLTGAVDLLLVIIWVWFYREPSSHPRVNTKELAYILSDTPLESELKIPWRELLPHRQTWAFIVAKALTDGFWWFYLFGTPDFFSRKFNLGPADRRYMLVLIYLVSAAGAVAGGWLVGLLMKRGWTVNLARKMTMLLCAVAAMPVFLAASTSHRWVAVVLITLAAAAHQAWGANIMCLPGDMFPKNSVGSLTGIAGVCSTGAGMILMFLIGQLVGRGSSYLPELIMASTAYLIALFISHFLAPRLEPVQVEARQPSLAPN